MKTRRHSPPLPLRPRAGPAQGFTLVELLASMGIIVFVLSIAILAIGPALRGASTRDAARRMRAALDASRVRAIQQRRAVRFEAQVAHSGSMQNTPEQWGVTPNAGDPTFEWSALPEFVQVRTDVSGAGWSTRITGLSVTFGADASVKAIRHTTNLPVDGTPWSNVDDLDAPFRIRLHTVREAPDAEVDKGTCFIQITPLTGVFESYGFQEAATDDLPYKTSK
ncbi:MAG: prepilin-type N-terminal cleavage/methylation domain-containing protein [Gemmatimonadetes bacterium]|nr:prepilin-type N-terminal cleavage/methylation domain-containing protein [Gemmatimonadota bacterium]